MGRSSLLGLEHAAIEPAGRDTATLGPGDNSDSGSDMVGLPELDTDDPVERHPARRGVDARGAGAADIGVDRVFMPGGAADGGGSPREDEDVERAVIENATASDPDEDVQDDEDDEDEAGRGLEDEGDNIPGAHATAHRLPPGQNPAPDVPEQPGVPAEGGDEEVPADADPDANGHRPARAAGAGEAAARHIPKR